ncbi:6-hydroxymethylpterin diphosphokinase MptE-like protein [Magnetofaba australis]|uniref:6-hydroxymethylpterin diphosphokinase MptE-like domain-containing protein n=1 Tax=Magnetofaba australis IT-1 TaxID=1434232 RepID=A0A1Y2K4T6_9PROT|nr:6-hydroxymethylpterin diphosphokinase MptE-like protein [Magnetofaba australis]OSM03993.1 hypothetical protein MAIT1_03759 [Magnetofaba australis IT-1]
MSEIDAQTDAPPLDFGPFLTNGFGDRYLPAINREAFSRLGAMAFYKGHFGEELEREDHLFVCVGTDGGLLIRYVIDRGVPPGSRFLFIDFPEMIERLREEGLEADDLPKRIHLISPENWAEFAIKECSASDYLYLDNMAQTKSIAVLDAEFAPYLDLWHQVNNEIQQLRTHINMSVGTQIFMLRCLENLPENHTPTICLRDSMKGRAAALLAGGPSLDEALPWVKANRDRLVVLAVSRLAKKLQNAGIVPDIVFAIDPHDIAFFAAREMLEAYERTLFVNMYHCSSLLVGQWRGRRAYIGTLFPWECELNPDNPVFPGITVSHQALGTAVQMGFEQVVLCGFDLCFSKEGFTHVAGTVESAHGPFMEQTQYQVETNGGWMAETRHDFFNAIPSLSLLAQAGEANGTHVLNPSPAAARIDSVEHVPWEKISLPEPFDAWQTLLDTLPPDTPAARLEHYNIVLKELDRARAEMQKVRKLAVEGIECNARFFGRKGKPADFKWKQRMDAIEEEINGQHQEMAVLAKRWGMREFLKLSRPDKEKEWTDEEIEETGRRYYEIFRENAASVIKWLNETRSRVVARIEEEKPKPNLKMIIKQWEEDHQPARAQLYLQKRGESLEQLHESHAKRFRNLFDEYQKMLAEEDNPHKHFIQQMTNPMAAAGKAKQLFQHKDIERLKFYLEGLRRSAVEFQEEHVAMAEGYLAELEGRDADALVAYEKVTYPLLMLDALTRISGLHLTSHQIDKALPVMEKLAEMSPIRRPHYATLLALTGNGDKAIEIYTEYLELAPEDLVTLLKLAKLHAQRSEVEQARAALDKVLKIDPKNLPAKAQLAELDALEA